MRHLPLKLKELMKRSNVPSFFPVFKGDFDLAQGQTLKAACRHTYKNTIYVRDKQNPSCRKLK